MPSLVQLGLFLSPIAYGVSIIPPEWRSVYACNPMVAIIESFRWSLFGTEPDMSMIWMSGFVTVALLVTGLSYDPDATTAGSVTW